ncbi:5-formyltetrahydrofolate cyclo-ligase [Rhinocladiella mackenziei CBS 650.93]|uniref:5-formyltetrahydrofolate cyclo-ligase n=1 Tax=Rhinocladiella mackenziei CBS 650.93 TaxID=1442369 RepID=A0A0D2FCW1_9EURO|nr:5-formyltetrahydrofolate cyclo-ligase [Rhinocladiella mackenziei CBS 650.93]KIW99921.1 5-formyltetrahydrofolate cyclo-ligase [Rhinocladiella mackenziei CBS 650.93]
MALGERKASVRRKVREELQKIDSQEIERQSAIITKHVLQLPSYQNAKSIAIFLSMPGREVSTRDIVLQAFDDGKSVFVPYLHPGEAPESTVMDMLQLRDMEDFHSLRPDSWGIPSLSKTSVNKRRNALGGIGVSNEPLDGHQCFPILDLIFMPAVAFDQSLGRLGHGKGFYDRYLKTYKDALESSKPGQKMPHLIGIALQQQMLPPGENIPVNEDDWKVDQVVVAGV